jgi:acetyl esterase/lipase
MLGDLIMTKRFLRLLLSFLLILSISLNIYSQEKPFEIKLWEETASGKNCSEGEEIVEDKNPQILDRHVRNITVPTLTIYLPNKNKTSGAGVVICPGGGYWLLALDKEGHDVARWLNELGVAGFVLKYRMPCPKKGNYTPLPLLDAQRAIRLVRSKALEWHLNTKKIGFMGFSAGGHLTTTVGTHYDLGKQTAKDPVERLSSRPDFLIPIYPVISLTKEYSHTGSRKNLLGENPSSDWLKLYSNELQVTPDTPPTFLIHTGDDRVSAQNSIDFYLALKSAGVAVEMHLFAEGGHGYGLRKTGKPVSTWPKRCEEWLRTMNLIK